MIAIWSDAAKASSPSVVDVLCQDQVAHSKQTQLSDKTASVDRTSNLE